MSRINLVGTQHHEPRVKERTAEVIQNNDFDSLFVEGVSPEDADAVEEAANKWFRQVSESTGMNVPEGEENGRFEEAVAAEENFGGDINYLDSKKSMFLNIRDSVKDDLTNVNRGEISSPRVLIDPDVTKEQVHGLMRMFSPDPDLPYHVFIGDMEEDEYREHLAESAVELYRETFTQAGHTLSEEQENLVYSNVLEKAPSQEELRQSFRDDIYSHETEQDREEHWLDVFEENYDGEDTALFVGIAHLDEDADSFYNKLLDSGYDVDRYALKDFTEF